jgi:hypothetical protein
MGRHLAELLEIYNLSGHVFGTIEADLELMCQSVRGIWGRIQHYYAKEIITPFETVGAGLPQLGQSTA